LPNWSSHGSVGKVWTANERNIRTKKYSFVNSAMFKGFGEFNVVMIREKESLNVRKLLSKVESRLI